MTLQTAYVTALPGYVTGPLPIVVVHPDDRLHNRMPGFETGARLRNRQGWLSLRTGAYEPPEGRRRSVQVRFYRNINCAAATLINDVTFRTCLRSDVSAYIRIR